MCLLFIPEFGDGRSHCKPSSRAQQGKNLPANAGDAGDRRRGFDPWVRKIPWGQGNGNPLQYSRLKNLMDRRAWWATVQKVAKSQTQLSD